MCFLTFGSLTNMILASATPRTIYATEADYMSIPITREFEEVIPVRLDLPPMGLFLEAKATNVDTSRTLFIVSSVDEAAGIVVALGSMGEQATLVSALKRTVPRSGHIVGTSVLEAGVNILPPPTLLISSGYGIVSNEGRVYRSPLNPDRLRQQLGRVARMGEGAAYVNIVAGTGDFNIPYPTHVEMLGDPSERAWLCQHVGITRDLEQVSNYAMLPSRGDAYMSLESNSWDRDTRTSLMAWWFLACSLGSTTAATMAYDTAELLGWSLEQEHIVSLLGGRQWIARRAHIQQLIDRRPFRCVVDGTVIRPLFITFKSGEVVWA